MTIMTFAAFLRAKHPRAESAIPFLISAASTSACRSKHGVHRCLVDSVCACVAQIESFSLSRLCLFDLMKQVVMAELAANIL